jgi:hypothetical protein
MIEAPAFDFNVPFGFDVARGTSSNSTRDTFLFPSWSSLIKMTDKTIGFVNSEVSSLYKLSMTGGASKVHSPSHLAQMSPMGKAYIFKYHISLEVFLPMTSLLQTITIVNFIMEFFEAFPHQEISQCELEVSPLSLEMI